MKRFLLFSLLLLPALASAQFSGRGKFFSFGVKVGANFSQLNTLEVKTPRLTGPGGIPVVSGGQIVYDFFQDNNSRTTGIVGGVFFRFGRKFFVQPEILVSAKGGSFDVVKTSLATQKIDVRFTTIDVPLLLGFKLGPLRLNAGPMASLTVSENQELKDALDQYSKQSIGDTFKQAVFGYQAGAGLTFQGLNLDVRYEGSLSDLSQIGLNPGDDTRFTSKTALWQLTVGFGF
ncbi:MAG: PorT family protein [Sphingobacteriaceae bacterium]|nr:PorT family protein [Cytophagaceae bacterium]